jgi:hypothetical protein
MTASEWIALAELLFRILKFIWRVCGGSGRGK